MTTSRTTLKIVAILALACQTIGCTSTAPEPSGAAVSGPSPARASSSCAALPSYTVLQIGKTETTAPKKVTDNCWWQFRVPDLHGYVDEPLGWQLCNACDVDVEFELKNVPAQALTGCNTFFDASNSAHETVTAGAIKTVNCRGLETVKDTYGAGARVAGASTPFVEDDPELEIEDRHFAAQIARLARTSGVSQCIAVTAGSRRLTISGQFARMNANTTVVLVPTGPGLSNPIWVETLWRSVPAKVKLLKLGRRQQASRSARTFPFS